MPAAVLVVVAFEDVRMLPCRSSPVRVRCPRVRCPRVRCQVCGVSAVRASVSALLASASALSARAGSCGARRCGAASRFGTGDFAVVVRPCPRAAGRPPDSDGIGAVEAVRASEASAADLAAVIWVRSGGGCGHVRPPADQGTAGWRIGSPVG